MILSVYRVVGPDSYVHVVCHVEFFLSTFTVPLNEYEPSICSDPMDKTTWYSTTDVMEYSHQKPWYSTISGVNSYLAIY
jgi:hypothetical protein